MPNKKQNITIAIDLGFARLLTNDDLDKINIIELIVTMRSELGNMIPVSIICDRLEKASISKTNAYVMTLTYQAHIRSDELDNTNLHKIKKLTHITIENKTDNPALQLQDFRLGTRPKTIPIKYLLFRSPNSDPGISIFTYQKKRFEIKTTILHNPSDSDNTKQTTPTKRYHIEYRAFPHVFEKTKLTSM